MFDTPGNKGRDEGGATNHEKPLGQIYQGDRPCRDGKRESILELFQESKRGGEEGEKKTPGGTSANVRENATPAEVLGKGGRKPPHGPGTNTNAGQSDTGGRS